MSASGFFSSAMGWKDLQYIGNVFNPGYHGCPPAALEKLGVSHDVMNTRMSPQSDEPRRRRKPASGSASASSAADSTPASICRRFAACATPTSSASGARTRRTPRRPRELARDLDVGDAKAYASITDMVADPAIDALWLSGPNHARIENVEEIVDAIERGKGTLLGIACEKPLARNVAEAKRVRELVKRAGIQHGYLENQVFAPQVETGRDAALGARRGDDRPPVPRARGGGAQRPAHAVVLAAASCRAAACSTT